MTNEGSTNPESATKDAENELTAENERDTPTKDNITEERDADAVLQSMMPLEEVRLETVDLTGYFATELTAVKLETLLPGVDLSDGSAIVWTTQGDDSYTVTDKNGTIDLSSYVSTYSNSRSYEIIVGTPDQLDRTNTRYLVTVRFDSPDLRDSLHVDAVYSNEERDDVGFLNHYFDADYTRQEDNQTGERGWIGLYEISVGETWQNSSVYLSMSRDANWPETLTAEVYEGTYLSLDSLDQAGDSANKITDKVWEKATVLKTAASTDLYEANCGTDRIDDAPKFTIVWKRGDTNVAVMPFMLWIYQSDDYVSISEPHKTGSSSYYSDLYNVDSETDETTGTWTRYYQVRNQGDKFDDQYYVTATFYHNQERTSHTEFGIKVVSSNRTYDTYQAAIADSANAKDVTEDIFSTTGYGADFSKGVVFTAFDKDGHRIDREGVRTLVRESIIYSNLKKAGDTNFSPNRSGSTYTMQSGNYSASDSYFVTATYTRDYEESEYNSNGIKVVISSGGNSYYSNYSTAISRGAVDVTNAIFSESGYSADFSNGITFTGFNSTGSRISSTTIRTVDYQEIQPSLSRETFFWATGANRSEEQYSSYSAYSMPEDADSYYINGYQTIFLMDGDSPVTGTIYPTFRKAPTARIFAELDKTSGEQQESGKSPVQMKSDGITEIHYSAAAETGVHLKNYWVTFLTPQEGARLFVNAETRMDEESNLPIRELVLTQENGVYHDIFFANIGSEDMTGITVELKDAQNVALDDYWTVRSEAADNARILGGFTTTNKSSYQNAEGQRLANNYGELANVAKVRLHPADDDIVGPISGSLMISSDNGGSREIKLTGMVGDIRITTENIRDGVKYVPYSSIIATNNMYDSDAVSFEITDGSLPAGLSIYPNGEIYGAPEEAGEFTFEVTATFSYKGSVSSSDSKEFTLIILDNSNENVDAQTDVRNAEGYEVQQFLNDMLIYVDATTPTQGTVRPATDVNRGSSGFEEIYYGYQDVLFISNGEYSDFKDLWLDGERLVPGVDYTASSGSTPINWLSQSVANTPEGKHTFSAEFWVGTPDANATSTNSTQAGVTQATKTAQRTTSQNVTIKKGNTSTPSNSSGRSGSSSRSSRRSYTITVNNPVAGGYLEVTPRTGSATVGTTVTIVAHLEADYTVSTPNVTGANVKLTRSTKSANTWTFPMPSANVTISASFTSTARYSITLTQPASGGYLSVNPEGSTTAGTTVTITVHPERAYEVASPPTVSGGVSVSGSGSNAWTFRMPATNVTINVALRAITLNGFTDIDATMWFFEDAQWAYNRVGSDGVRLIQGVTLNSWQPESKLTSISAALTLRRLDNASLDNYYGFDELTDAGISGNNAAAVRWARANGILPADIPINSTRELPRGEYAVILCNFLRHRGLDVTPTTDVTFSDDWRMTEEQRRAFRFLYEAGIFRGDSANAMLPQNSTKRSHLAALLHRLSEYIIRVETGG